MIAVGDVLNVRRRTEEWPSVEQGNLPLQREKIKKFWKNWGGVFGFVGLSQ